MESENYKGTLGTGILEESINYEMGVMYRMIGWLSPKDVRMFDGTLYVKLSLWGMARWLVFTAPSFRRDLRNAILINFGARLEVYCGSKQIGT